jgi:hypothetical protein
MTKEDEIAIWRHLRLLYEWHPQVAVCLEALRRLAAESGQGEPLLNLEKAASKETFETHEKLLREIDDIVRKLRLS